MEPNTEKNQQAEAQETAQETAKTALFVRLFRYDCLRQTQITQNGFVDPVTPLLFSEIKTISVYR